MPYKQCPYIKDLLNKDPTNTHSITLAVVSLKTSLSAPSKDCEGQRDRGGGGLELELAPDRLVPHGLS